MTQAAVERQTQPNEDASWQGRLAARDPALRVHLLGISGAGLSAIARVLLQMRCV